MIELRQLTKRYGAVTAVDALTCTVRPGRVTGFLGPNGAGKSTTMRLLLGLDRPTAGSATIGGRPYVKLRSPMRAVGALLDARAVHPRRSAVDHLLSLAYTNGIGRARATEVLSLVGLEHAGARRVGGFSIGMKQRLGLAVALLGDPPVLILDEPMNGLDPEGMRWMRGLLRDLAAEGGTVFLSSHVMTEITQTADHVIVIGKGRLLADAAVSDLLAGQTTLPVTVRIAHGSHREFARLLVARGAEVESGGGQTLVVTGLTSEEIGMMASQHGVALAELTAQHPSLEDVFMSLTTDHFDYRAERRDRTAEG